MTADDFINMTIDKGQSRGLAELGHNERFVFLIAEVEADCDMNGIDTFLDRYDSRVVADCATAFSEIGANEIGATLSRIARSLPERSEPDLDRVDRLIKDRAGYNYDSIAAAVQRRLDLAVFSDPTKGTT